MKFQSQLFCKVPDENAKQGNRYVVQMTQTVSKVLEVHIAYLKGLETRVSLRLLTRHSLHKSGLARFARPHSFIGSVGFQELFDDFTSTF
jgi:hypothetical protein